ncbi:unnamed protein product [Rotaria sordida]|uniref:Uncharacterized protein n=1 Tax=Rotaria sordida TaxID=392033 RepID=A0A816C113_9BILA|nr:unnamed protein product [Rotaria sordida]CAF1618608.1 unnamed protein product [Rotaria sordida]
MVTVTNFRYTTSPIIIILGATAVGKTKLSVYLSKRFNGEIINADSMQIYEGLDIITAKPTITEQDNVPHHLFSYVNPLDRSHTVVDYRNDALPIIESVVSRSHLSFIVGGTNCCIESLLFHFNPPNPSPKHSHDKQFTSLLNDLSEENLSKLTSVQLHESLSKIDKPIGIRRHPNEEQRKNVSRVHTYAYNNTDSDDKFIQIISEIIEFYRDSGGIPLSSFGFHSRFLLRLTCQKEELKKFHDEYNQTCTQAEQSYNYTRGIFQAIGFKEFHDYLLLSNIERKSEHGEKVFANVTPQII